MVLDCGAVLIAEPWLLSLIYGVLLAASVVPLGIFLGSCSQCCRGRCDYDDPDKVLVDLAAIAGGTVYRALNIVYTNNFGTFNHTRTFLIKPFPPNGVYELTRVFEIPARWQYSDEMIAVVFTTGAPGDVFGRTAELIVSINFDNYRIKTLQGLGNVVSQASMEAETWDDDAQSVNYQEISRFMARDPNRFPVCTTMNTGLYGFQQQCSSGLESLFQHRFYVSGGGLGLWETPGGLPLQTSWEFSPHPPPLFPWRVRLQHQMPGTSFLNFGGGLTQSNTVIAGSSTPTTIPYIFDVTRVRFVYGVSETEFPFL